MKTSLLFLGTAVAEIVGCYALYAYLRLEKPGSVLFVAAAGLGLFAWLLTLHPMAAGRTYAAYGGVYVAASLAWLWLFEGVKPSSSDLIGVALCLVGTAVIAGGANGTKA
ncbi:MAG TPA: YnfA family protein [Fimbriimonadaceae bacterium]|nr:YnfA family protein [Fimbriimonadaceae bacterium]HRJ97679.1 YnfA family protein [Fimbriimonadaceae bacterium]